MVDRVSRLGLGHSRRWSVRGCSAGRSGAGRSKLRCVPPTRHHQAMLFAGGTGVSGLGARSHGWIALSRAIMGAASVRRFTMKKPGKNGTVK